MRCCLLALFYYKKGLKTESAKLCAQRAKSVLACQRALRAYVSRVYFLRASVPCVLTSSRVNMPCVLTCLPVNIPCELTCLCESVSCAITLIHM